MDRRQFLSLLGAAAVGAAVTGCAPAVSRPTDGTRLLTFALDQNEEHPTYAALQEFGASLYRATDGRYDIDVYANGTLGGQQDVIQLVGDGSIDMAVLAGVQIENIGRSFQVLNLPGLFDGIDHQVGVTNNIELLGELYASLEDRGLSVIGAFTQGERNVYTIRPVRTPEDLTGMKIRVQESDVFIDMVNGMGGSATPMPYAEVYTALQAGILDGAENNEISFVTQKHFEVAKNYTLTKHLVGLDYVVIHSQVLRDMSPPDRAVFREEWLAASANHTRMWKQQTLDAVETMQAGGVSVLEVDRAPFQQRLERVAEKYLTDPRDRQLYDRIKALGAA